MLPSSVTIKDFTENLPKIHPCQKTIKDQYKSKIIRAHNTVGNPVYPKPKEGRKPILDRIYFTVIGNRVTKEFIYCVKMVQNMHKYRWQVFGAPHIKGVSGLEWPLILNELKVKYREHVCLMGQVAVLYNDDFLGGEKELKELIEERYIYHMSLNYPKESIELFKHFVNSTGRTCVYMHIAVDDEPIGCLIFMLYSDIAPNTCENFMRLCQTKKGGYSGTPVHRIVEDGWIQCGGFGLKDTPLGCENFIVPHDKRGVLSMCNAERDIDCSTQFFVLLQPAVWMNQKYVAFGQLIEGEGTLKKIEKIPTFYESPTKKIIIFKSGVLNLECDDIMINRGAVAYIHAHMEDLVSLGEMLYEWLMERVDLELQFRYLNGLQPQSGEGSLQPQNGERENEAAENIRHDNLRATERFMRNKEEIRSELGTTIPVAQSKSSVRSQTSRMDKPVKVDFKNFKVEDNQLNEFAGKAVGETLSQVGENSQVEENSQVGETYSQVTTTEYVAIEKRPYYIQLTDVPYSGETDSNYDLKRFLQGDYCLPEDLDPKPRVKGLCRCAQKEENAKLNAIFNIMPSYKDNGSSKVELNEDQVLDASEDDVVDEEEIESISTYLRENMEKISFSGDVVEAIAKKNIKSDPILKSRDTFNDEEIRRMRMILQDFKKKPPSKHVSVKVSSWKTSNKVPRRQTGYVKKINDSEDDEDEEDLNDKQRRQVVIVASPWKTHTGIMRRPTGFIRTLDLENDENSTDDDEDGSPKKESTVSIEPESLEQQAEQRKSTTPHNTSLQYTSVLSRLFDENARLFDEEPTLKEYKSMKDKMEKLIPESCNNLMAYLAKERKVSGVGVLDRLSKVNEESSRESELQLTTPEYIQRLTKRRITVEAYQAKNKLNSKKND